MAKAFVVMVPLETSEVAAESVENDLSPKPQARMRLETFPMRGPF